MRALTIIAVLLVSLASSSRTARAQPVAPEVVRSWDPARLDAFSVGHAVVDLPRGMVYAMVDRTGAPNMGAQPRNLQLSAYRLDNGRRRWTSRAAVVPITVEGGRLLALRAAFTSSELVVLDPRSGRARGVCAGASFTVGDGLGYSSTLVAVRARGATHIVFTDRTSYAGGAAPDPSIDYDHTNTRVYALSVSASSCTLTPAHESVLGSSATSTDLLRTRDGTEWVYSLSRRGEPPREIGRLSTQWGAEVSNDGLHVVMREANGATVHTTLVDGLTGARVLELDLDGVAGFTIVGGVVLGMLGGTLVGCDAQTGSVRYRIDPASLGYHGPYPP